MFRGSEETTSARPFGAVRTVLVSLAAASALCAAPVWAEEDDHGEEHHGEEHGGHAHHSDIEFEFASGMIEIEFASPGMVVFESDFNEEIPMGVTDDPGFDNEEKPAGVRPTAGSLLGFDVLGPLAFWNGTAFADAGSASITIEDALFNELIVSSATTALLADFTTGSETNIIAQADPFGIVHEHVDFALNDGALGAYGLVLALTTDEAGVADSRRFGIFFNNGLEEAAFELGVDAFNAQVVPLPAGVWLFGSGLGLLFARARRASA